MKSIRIAISVFTALLVLSNLLSVSINGIYAQGQLPTPYPNLSPALPNPLPIPTTSNPYAPHFNGYSNPIDSLLAEYPKSQEDRKKQILEQLSNLVKEEFDKRHQAHQREIQAFEEELAKRKKVYEKRDAIKDKIIADRISMLVQIAEGTGWNPPTEANHPGAMIPVWSQPSFPPTPPHAFTPATPSQPAVGNFPSPIAPSPSIAPPIAITPVPLTTNLQTTSLPNGVAPTLQPQTDTTAPPLGFPPAAPNLDRNYPKARVSYEDFKELVQEVEPHREKRILSLDQFIEMSKQPNVIILDTRSDFRFERIHIKGAKHLSFTDFTQANLANVIPSPETTILIYCNNNFDGNPVDFASKSAPPRKSNDRAILSQVAALNKPVQLALNVPTYINLYGYGYQNVYELGELVKVTDPRIELEGSIVENGK